MHVKLIHIKTYVFKLIPRIQRELRNMLASNTQHIPRILLWGRTTSSSRHTRIIFGWHPLNGVPARINFYMNIYIDKLVDYHWIDVQLSPS